MEIELNAQRNLKFWRARLNGIPCTAQICEVIPQINPDALGGPEINFRKRALSHASIPISDIISGVYLVLRSSSSSIQKGSTDLIPCIEKKLFLYAPWICFLFNYTSITIVALVWVHVWDVRVSVYGSFAQMFK